MAGKAAVMVIIDVRVSEEALADSLRAVKQLVQTKLIYSPKDLVGVLLVGTEHTDNSLQEVDEDGTLQYAHISKLCEVDVPTLDVMKSLEENVRREEAEVELIDAIIVGMHELVEVVGKKKFTKTIFLLTDGSTPLGNIEEEQLQAIVDRIVDDEVDFKVLGKGFTDPEDSDSDSDSEDESESAVVKSEPAGDDRPDFMKQNEAVLRAFVEQVNGSLFSMKTSIELMSRLRKAKVNPTTTFRGALELGPVGIGVWCFAKTMERKFPTLKKTFIVEREDATARDALVDDLAGGEIEIAKSFATPAAPDVDVPADDRIKGYRYGKTFVPVSAVDDASMKYLCAKELKVIAFADSATVTDQYYLTNSEIVVPAPNSDTDSVALSALVRALLETDMVAIVRYVKRNNSAPQLGVLRPYQKSDIDCFIYHKLCFDEDVRQYPFQPLKGPNANKHTIPQREQLICASELIDSMMLDEDQLTVKQTFNPILQHFYQCVQERALHPEKDLTPLDPVVESYLKPDADVMNRSEASRRKFKDLFPLKVVEKASTQKRAYWKDLFSEGDGDPLAGLDDDLNDDDTNLRAEAAEEHEARGKRARLDSAALFSQSQSSQQGPASQSIGSSSLAPAAMSIDQLMKKKVVSVGASDPIGDFRALMASRDSPDTVTIAIKGLSRQILRLLTESVGEQLFDKAVGFVRILREGCVQEDEAEMFNEFLSEIRQYTLKSKSRAPFWDMLRESDIEPINDEESGSSSLSLVMAKSFWSDDKAPASAAATSVANADSESESDEDDVDADDLLDML